jgi:hypothetical protein
MKKEIPSLLTKTIDFQEVWEKLEKDIELILSDPILNKTTNGWTVLHQ